MYIIFDHHIDGAFIFGVTVLLLLGGLTLWSWRRSFGPGHGFFLLTHLGVIGWLALTVLQVAAVNIPDKIFWHTMTTPMLTLSSTSWCLFLLEFSPVPVRAVKRWGYPMLAVVTSVMAVLALTNGWHQALITPETRGAMIDGRSSIIPGRGWMFYAMAAHNFAWIALASVVSLYGFKQATDAFKPIYGNLLAMMVVPVGCNLCYLAFDLTLAGVDPTPYALVISLIAYGWILVNSRLLSLDVVGERHLFREADSPMMICNREGQLVSVNPFAERLFEGPGASEMKVMSAKLIAALVAGGEIDSLHHHLIAGRAYRASVLTVGDVVHPDRGFLGWTISLIDVTQEEETAQRLRAAVEQSEVTMRTHKELVSVISHELRTPLTSIIGTLNLLAGGGFGALPDKAAHGIKIAQRNGTRLVKLINDLLDLQKLEAGQFQTSPQEVDLKKALRAAAEELEGYGAARDVRLELSLDGLGEDDLCMIDPERLQQVIANVVSNAVKFSADGDVVRISTVRLDEFAEVQIADNGPGIPEGAEEKVFGRFAQLDSSSARAYEGTGLGMTIAQLMIEHMGGHIFYRSELGVGTTFCLWIPLAEASAAKAAA